MNNSSWSTQTFGVFAEFKNGLNYNSEAVGNGLKIIGVADFKSRRTLDYKYLAQVSGFDDINDGYLLKNHDLVFVRSNGNKALIGRVLFINNLKERLTFSGFTIRARVKDESWFPEYVSYIFGSEIARSQYYKLGSGTNISNLSQEILDVIEVPKPSLKEQHKITDILNLWENSISRVELLVFEKNEIRKGLMQQLLSGKQRLPEFTKTWKKVHLGEVFSNRTESNNDELPLLSITSKGGVVNRDTINKKDSSNKDKSRYLRICPGDIGYNTMRMWQGVSGLSSLEGIVSPAYTVVIPDNSIDGEFMAVFFKYPPMVNLFRRYSQGLVDDTLNLKFHHFSEIEVTIPEKEEQVKIVSVFRVIDKELEILNKKLDALKEQKKGLMQQLLTGKKRVKVKDVA